MSYDAVRHRTTSSDVVAYDDVRSVNTA